jgi:hypothetical protein
MEAQNFISEKEIQSNIEKLVSEKKDSITFLDGKRVKIAIFLKNSNAYREYEKHLLQYDVTRDNEVYTVIIGAK